ncbi:hypothetical protein [Streptomyces luteogriseus]|uniref:hypothetical protein n=1 Tax=Streptomyces luteogriseus TaxID=68233 RepID=UPI00378F5E78
MQFDYTVIGEVGGSPTYLVRITEAWVPNNTVLGVVRQATRTRIPGNPLMWTAALSVEADHTLWPKKGTKSFFEQDHAAVWLLGVRDALLNPHAEHARALLEEVQRRSTNFFKCPQCDEMAQKEMSGQSAIECESCGTELRHDAKAEASLGQRYWYKP